MRVNKDKLASITGEVKKALGVLKEYQVEDEETLIQDLKALGAIKYYFILAIEACVDICNHIIAKEYSEAPESYADCFRILREKGIISNELAENLMNMAKFRNLLVHLYSKVDNKRLFSILKENLSDIEKYLAEINQKYLK
ncbi:MAG: DUF86 domain-containing protein [Euryarchaeota archaeon]|nr:DUF86 domain-containing protein [Euryarchaeota archaeon]